jgi:hypothetical protein
VAIHPQMTEAGKLRLCPIQQRLDPLIVHYLGTVDLRLEDETLSVHQDVTLTPFDLLTSVVTPIFAAYRGALDRLGIHHPGTGLGISVQANPEALADCPVDPLPSTVDTPGSEVVVDGGPSLGKS